MIWEGGVAQVPLEESAPYKHLNNKGEGLEEFRGNVVQARLPIGGVVTNTSKRGMKGEWRWG